MSMIEETFKMLRQDLDELDARHVLGCPRCSPKHVCGYALGIAAAYRKVEERLSPRRVEFPTIRHSLETPKPVTEDRMQSKEEAMTELEHVRDLKRIGIALSTGASAVEAQILVANPELALRASSSQGERG